MTVHLVKKDNKFYITDNPNKLGSEVTLECASNADCSNEWCLEIITFGTVDLKILVESKKMLHRPPGTPVIVDRVIDVSVIDAKK